MCERFNGDPFPTKRKGMCHIGQYIYEKKECETSYDFNYYYSKKSPLCPIACRPKDHQDWENC